MASATLKVRFTEENIYEMVRDLEAAGLADWLRAERPDVVALLQTRGAGAGAGAGARKEEGVVLPAAGAGGSAPSAAAYRIPAVKAGCCVGRRVYPDHRWSVKVYGETQCERTVVEGSDICVSCATHLERFTRNGGPDGGNSFNWHGRVTEEPPCWLHMLGTEWAAQATVRQSQRLVWLGDITLEQRARIMAEEAATRKAEEAAAKAVLKAEKEATKAAAKAEKEAAKAAAKAAKEAEKEAKRIERAIKKGHVTVERGAGAGAGAGEEGPGVGACVEGPDASLDL
jgi:hypothetical protein